MIFNSQETKLGYKQQPHSFDRRYALLFNLYPNQHLEVCHHLSALLNTPELADNYDWLTCPYVPPTRRARPVLPPWLFIMDGWGMDSNSWFPGERKNNFCCSVLVKIKQCCYRRINRVVSVVSGFIFIQSCVTNPSILSKIILCVLWQ